MSNTYDNIQLQSDYTSQYFHVSVHYVSSWQSVSLGFSALKSPNFDSLNDSQETENEKDDQLKNKDDR